MTVSKKTAIIILFLFAISIGLLTTYKSILKKNSVSKIEKAISIKVEKRLTSYFIKSNAKYLPEKVVFIAYKSEKILEVWALNDSYYSKIKSYKILAASGISGPKLKNNDKQVPEGIYHIKALNPYSKFYLSMELNYPNSYDKKMALNYKRKDLGNEIYIHGKNKSRGCLAMGDEAIEDLFILVSKVGKENITVIISPNIDVKNSDNINIPWINNLYSTIRKEIDNVVTSSKS